jgi:hypothetical protein
MLCPPRIRRPLSLRSVITFALVLAAAAAAPAHAQTVQGRAVDRETQQPIADASLVLMDAEGNAVVSGRSGADGSFSLTAPRAGEYRLTASRIGYRNMLSSAVSLGEGQVVQVEARIAPQPVAMDTALARADGPAGISGRVLESGTDRPVGGATVTLLNRRGLSVRQVVTREDGRFHLRVRDPGGHQIRAQRVGFTPSTSPSITVTPGDTVQVEMRIATAAVVLTPLTVVAASRDVLRDQQLAEFDWRREHQAWGRYIGPDQIKHINPFYASDVLQHVPFVQVSGGAQRSVTLRAPHGRGRCNPTVYVDGHFVPTSSPALNSPRNRGGGAEITLDEVVSGSTIAAVEVYDKPALAPAEYLPRNGLCGVIVIWTRPAEERQG